MEGYKVFEPDWTCRGFQYEVGKTFEEDDEPICCKRGFHFCKELKDCFSYYSFDPDNKVAKVIALGDIDEESDSSKCCTNKIQIVEEISWEDVLRMVNIGKRNSGRSNVGKYNSGNGNIGNYNSGGHNSGDYNTGFYNTGDHNGGRCNSGDFNMTNYSNGCFNTEEPKIYLFNKPSNWTFREWLNSDAKQLLNNITLNVTEWVWSDEMTDKEKENHPNYKFSDGYLRKLWLDPFYAERQSRQVWWDSLSEEDKNIIKAIPNFDEKSLKRQLELKYN